MVLSARWHRPTSTFEARAAAAGLLALFGAGCSGTEAPPDGGVGVQRIVFAVRQHTVVDGEGVHINVAGGAGQVMDYLRYVPGARLEVYDLASRTAQNILEGFTEADVSSLDVSFDGTKVVFSMKQNADDDYHLYWASVDRGPDDRFELHQLTFGPHDDVHPVWLPGDRIAFVTNQGYTEMGTRADEYNHSRVVSQIATITLGGGDADRKLCSQNLSHTIDLFPLSDGRLGFSRWEHLENVNDVKLFAMQPDCTQMVALGGQHGKLDINSLIQVVESRTPNVFYAVATARENTLQSGALVRVDARAASDPLRVDEQAARFDVLTDVPVDEAPSSKGRYRTPSVLPDGRLLTSWAKGFVNELNELALTPPDFGIYVYEPSSGTNQLVVNYEDTWELYARPLSVRAEPPLRGSIQNTADPSVPAVLGSIDVRRTSLEETVDGAQFAGTALGDALRQAVKVRLIEGFSSEAAAGVSMFGLTMAEGAAILGEAKVYEDGSWRASVPPYIPIHVQPVDEFDLAIRNQTTWIQGMPGESRICGGCHESRVDPNLPGGQQLTIAAAEFEQGRGEDFMRPITERTEYPWYAATDASNVNEIQKIFDARCVSCHNETTNGDGPQEFYELVMNNTITGESTSYQIPRLDLSSRPITVTYDGDVEAWPASYVSLFYPSALRMEMAMSGSEVTGEVPPEWAIPSDARGSLLIEKLNVTSAFDATQYAWPLGEPFTENAPVKGGTRTDHAAEAGMTREEIVMLIRAIDMGGQYYSRQNTDFVPFNNDPLAGREY